MTTTALDIIDRLRPRPHAEQVNEPLLREVMAFIKIHPELWDQNFWSKAEGGCGTSYCLAGWTYLLGNDMDLFAGYDFNDDVAEDAMELLGLSRIQAYRLFHFTSVHRCGAETGAGTRWPSPSCVRLCNGVTYPELVDRVREVTGIDCKDGQE